MSLPPLPTLALQSPDTCPQPSPQTRVLNPVPTPLPFVILTDQWILSSLPHTGVEDAVTYMLHKSLYHLEFVSIVGIVFVFSSAFNTIQPSLPRNKMKNVGWTNVLLPGLSTTFPTDHSVKENWIVYQTQWWAIQACHREQFWSPFLFNLYTADFSYNSDSCHIQKFSADQ